IGSHGQTVWHSPRLVSMPGAGSVRSSLQIGDPSVIAERTGITTVADFRARDLAAGGEGAPLTPYVHYHVFQSRRKSRLIVNLGGIANVTWLPRGGGLQDVVACDVGPCNLLLDGLLAQATHGQQSIDRNGTLAARGCEQNALVQVLLRHPFLARRPPKSTGREEFGDRYIRRTRQVAARRGLSLEDTLASACAGIARMIRESGPWAVDEVIAGGGGVRNRGLMGALKREFGPDRVMSMDQAGVKSQALEAMAFAVLAHETIRGVPANLPWVTGAKSPVVLGTVTPGRNPIVFTP
ncbi:MAG: anhydro-N-acetylmuramic acid kinase, partial [Nitrospira sp.]|nr:anhydro-N-acetylmuramic acid kinase [Nitrospira sp.]